MIPLKYSQALQGFFLSAQARKLSPRTISDYETTLIKKFQPFLGKDLLVEEITPHHVEEFFAAQTTVSKKTVLNYHVGLSAFRTWALREKIAREHIMRAVPASKPEHRDIAPYTEQDIRSMLNSLERSKRYSRPGNGYGYDIPIPYTAINSSPLVGEKDVVRPRLSPSIVNVPADWNAVL